jgi:hypothetical protein
MGRKKRESTRIRSFKLPVRLYDLLKKASEDRNLTVNATVWRLVEDFLIEFGYMDEKDRKRDSLRD